MKKRRRRIPWGPKAVAEEPTPSTPRGGKTTVTSQGLHRKTVYFSDDEWKAVRARAYEEDRAYTDVIRDAVRRDLGLNDPGGEKRGQQRLFAERAATQKGR